MRNIILFLILTSSFSSALLANNDSAYHYKLIEKHFVINHDLSYNLDLKKTISINDAAGIKYALQDSIKFTPQLETLRFKAAFVVHSKGSKETVNKELIHTRNLFSSQSTTGYLSQLEKVLLFPNVRSQDTVVSRWQINHFVPNASGFNILSDFDISEQIDEEIIYLNVPVDLALHWKKRGNVLFKEHREGNRRLIEAHIKNIPAQSQDAPMLTRPLSHRLWRCE